MLSGTRAIARAVIAAKLNVRIEGAEHLPRHGPVLLAARHYHHLFDGAVLVGALARPVHMFVALDWARTSRERRLMEGLCRFARWPVALREREPGDQRPSAYVAAERRAYLRAALRDSVGLLRDGRVLAIFPEGSPVVDPHATGEREREMLPFATGFTAILRAATRAGTSVPLVPAGFSYRAVGNRTAVTLRLGAAMTLVPGNADGAFAEEVEARVRALSTVQSR